MAAVAAVAVVVVAAAVALRATDSQPASCTLP